MRPVALRVSGFTCFRDDQPALDFTGLDLFAISGPTGAGKSSVLDAITYGLYGKVPRMGGQGVKELISHGRDRMTVMLTFAINGDRYQVTRTTRRTGSGQCQLDRVRGDRPEHIASGVTQVNDAVCRLLGLDYDAFTQAVLLPQGQFARFLKGAAADRRKVLQELLRLTVYNRMRELAAQRCTTAGVRVGVIEQQLHSLAFATPEALAHKEAERQSLDETLDRLALSSREARRQHDDLLARVQLARERGVRHNELDALIAQQPRQQERRQQLERADRARQIASSLDQLELHENTHAARLCQAHMAQTHLVEAQRAFDRAREALVQTRSDAAALPDLSARCEALRALDGRIRHRDALRAECRRLEQSSKDAQADRARHAEAVTARQTQLDAATARRAKAEADSKRVVLDPAELAACESGRDLANELRRDRLEIPSLDVRVRAARKGLTEARRAHVSAQEAVDAAAVAHARALHERDEAWRRQQALLDAHRAMTLRSHLTPGHTCPVCEQHVAVVPAVAAAPELREADAAVNETAEAVRHAEISQRKVQQVLGQAMAAAEGAHVDLANAERERATVGARLAASEETLRRRLSRYLPATAERMPDHWLLERLDLLRELQSRHEQAQRACQLARETTIAAEGALALAVQARAAGEREAAALQQQLTARQEECEAVSREIAQVTTADDPRAELAALALQIERLESAVAVARDAITRHEVALAAAEAAARHASDALREAEEALAHISGVVAQALVAFAFEGPQDARAALLSAADVAHLQQECDAYVQAHAVLVSRISDLDARIGPAPASEAALAVAIDALARAERDLTETMRRRGELDAQLATLRQRLDEAALLRTQLSTAQAEHETYTVLSTDLQANAFQDWLLTEVFERLVRGASTRLMELTSRYTLEWVGNEFYVVDHDNARERRTADTLSGGETFLASLALALELSEQVQRASGAVRLDSLFIDEGFGSLDANAQDVVATAIESLQVSGRMVGIITHIRELTDRMPACIVIDKRPEGSRWTVGG